MTNPTNVADAPTQQLPNLQQEIADVEEAVAHFPGALKETKAGYKTTEFWLALATIVLAQLDALHLPGKYGDTIATVAALVAYIVSRGVAKAGVPAVTHD